MQGLGVLMAAIRILTLNTMACCAGTGCSDGGHPDITIFNTASSAAPQDSTVPTDAGIEPRTVATGALTVRRSNH